MSFLIFSISFIFRSSFLNIRSVLVTERALIYKIRLVIVIPGTWSFSLFTYVTYWSFKRNPGYGVFLQLFDFLFFSFFLFFLLFFINHRYLTICWTILILLTVLRYPCSSVYHFILYESLHKV